ncbi:MAG: M20 family metallopeptidase [Peptococcaceae bacterium]|nr:M20 family metallopeptidase [Peptococcaceae bacterium]
MSIYAEACALAPELTRWRRHLHQHAEGAYDLDGTLAFIHQVLDEAGVAYSEPCPSALVAEIGEGAPGMMLRADMDALPMKEESGLDFASVTDYAHTCGHDFHTAMLLGAAVLLKRHEAALTHRTRLIFQPDEEGGSGAKYLLDHGVLNADAAGAFALHMSPTQDSGVLYYQDGALYTSADEFLVTVKGKSAHGAAPHTGIDPVFAAVQIYNAMQGLISRETPPQETAVLSLCTISGGKAFNVVPDSAIIRGTIRTYSEAVRNQLKTRAREVALAVGGAFHCDIDFHFVTEVPVVNNDAALNAQLLTQMRADDVTLAEQPQPFSWSEDFSFFGSVVPAVMMTLGAHVDGCTSNIHNADVLFDERALPIGAAAHVLAALSVEK